MKMPQRSKSKMRCEGDTARLFGVEWACLDGSAMAMGKDHNMGWDGDMDLATKKDSSDREHGSERNSPRVLASIPSRFENDLCQVS